MSENHDHRTALCVFHSVSHHQNEGVEARIFLLLALDLIQSIRLVTAKPGGQLLEPLPLRTLKLEKTDTYANQQNTVPQWIVQLCYTGQNNLQDYFQLFCF